MVTCVCVVVTKVCAERTVFSLPIFYFTAVYEGKLKGKRGILTEDDVTFLNFFTLHSYNNLGVLHAAIPPTRWPSKWSENIQED